MSSYRPGSEATSPRHERKAAEPGDTGNLGYARRSREGLRFRSHPARCLSFIVRQDTVFEDAPIEYRNREIRYRDAEALVSVGRDVHARDAKMHPGAASAWVAMVSAALKEGAYLQLVSAFRSTDDQARIVAKKWARGLSWVEILRVSAYPGFSEHHTGRAVDIACPSCPRLVEEFDHTPEFRWLSVNADRFAFTMSYPRGNLHGIAYEPWHWFWTSK